MREGNALGSFLWQRLSLALLGIDANVCNNFFIKVQKALVYCNSRMSHGLMLAFRSLNLEVKRCYAIVLLYTRVYDLVYVPSIL